MKKTIETGLYIGAGLIIGIIISKMFDSSPKIKVNPFTKRENNNLPVLNFEIDGKRVESIDGDGNGSGGVGENDWVYTKVGNNYIISAFNTKTGKASSVVVPKP